MAFDAAYDRLDVAICGIIVLLAAMAFYLTNRTPDEFDNEPSLTRVEKLMVWIMVFMFAALLFTVAVRR